MNKTIIGVVAILVVVGGVTFFSSNKAEAPSENIPSVSDAKVESLGIPALPDEVRVVISGHRIQNGTLTVSVGTTVVFENTDSLQGLPYDTHTITTGTIDPTGKSGVLGVVPNSGSGVPDGLINAPLKKNGEFSFTFSEPGIVTFYISEHPLVAGEGTVTITAVEEMIVVDSETDVSEDEFVFDEVIPMDSASFFFAPDRLKVKVGEEINIDITSKGLHTFTIDELGIDVRTLHGKTTRVSFIPDKVGVFTYYCAIPGHKEAGQVGTLTVVTN